MHPSRDSMSTMPCLFWTWILICIKVHAVTAVARDDVVSSLLSGDSAMFSRQQLWSDSSVVRSKARLVVPNVNHGFWGEDGGDTLLPASASELWNELSQPHGLHPHEPKEGPNSSCVSDLTLHLTGIEANSPQSTLHNLNLQSYCKKTGTTIAGCVINMPSKGPYVILAADTRATNGNLVADKTCSKIHPLASNCWCCGAGTSGDLDKVTRQVLYGMSLRELHRSSIGNGDIVDGSTRDNKQSKIEPSILYQQGFTSGGNGDVEGRPLIYLHQVSIPAICNTFQDMFFKNQGNLGANLIVGGVWQGRGYLRAIHPHGSIDVGLPFAALGSGGLAAMATLEEGYRDNLSLEEGITLVQRAILSGICNDLGSGSQVDMCLISPDGSSRHTRCTVPEEVLEDIQIATKEEDKSPSVPSIGVNGFGNTPFAIESTRERIVSIKADKERQTSRWNEAFEM